MTNCAPGLCYTPGMETIYIDRLFILNLAIDYLLTLGSARVCGVRLRRLRYFFSALFGAAYAVCTVFPKLFFLRAALIKLAAGVIMSLIAFGNEEKLLRCTLVFLSVSAFFGGAVWAIASGGEGVGGSRLYLPVSMPVLALSFGICYAVLSLVFRRLGRNAARRVHGIEIELEGKSVKLTALEDSGNALCDPISGSPVMIASAASLMPLFEGRAGRAELSDAPALVSKLSGRAGARLIPYKAVGTESGLLAAFRPDALYIDGKRRDGVMVAISPSEISGDGFDSII